MKKSVIAILTAAAAATVLTACAPSSPDLSMPTTDRANAETDRPAPVRQVEQNESSTDTSMHKAIIHGTVRKAFDPSGIYTTEYMHFSPSNKPETLPTYSLELKDDNTFTFHADVNGVVSDHYGNYYIKHGGSLILFYDEPIESSPHNVYVADSMYMEMMPHGKIMFYDNCGTIVLAKSTASPISER